MWENIRMHGQCQSVRYIVCRPYWASDLYPSKQSPSVAFYSHWSIHNSSFGACLYFVTLMAELWVKPAGINGTPPFRIMDLTCYHGSPLCNMSNLSFGLRPIFADHNWVWRWLLTHCSLYSDSIWRYRHCLTSVQVIAWCLTAPSHYLANGDLSSARSSDIHLRTILLETPQPSNTKFRLKITYPNIHSNLPGGRGGGQWKSWRFVIQLFIVQEHSVFRQICHRAVQSHSYSTDPTSAKLRRQLSDVHVLFNSQWIVFGSFWKMEHIKELVIFIRHPRHES